MEDNQKEQKKASSGKIRRIVLSILGGLAVLLLLGAGIAAATVQGFLNRLNRPEPTQTAATVPALETRSAVPEITVPEITVPETTVPETEPTEPEGDYITNILVIGQSYREGEETKLADSIILVTVDRSTGTVTLTSFLRDLYIQMPHYAGHLCGRNRINVVYNLGWKWTGTYGGMEMMDLCLLQNFGVHVDHNIEVGFDTFSELVDSLGGIDLELDETETKYMNHVMGRIQWEDYHFETGLNHLDGESALQYARMRKTDSDIARTERQRKIIGEILNQLKNKSTLELTGLLYNIAPTVLTDMSDDEILSLFWDMVRMLPKLKLESAMCPAPGTYWGKIIDLDGYLSGVIECNVQKNREILVERCEVPLSE